MSDIIRLERKIDALTKLLARKSDRYPMCDDQPAQIDCRIETCIYHHNAACTNVSPAITLNTNGHFACWSQRDRDEA